VSFGTLANHIALDDLKRAMLMKPDQTLVSAPTTGAFPILTYVILKLRFANN